MSQPDYDLITSFRQEHSVLATARQSLILEVNFILEEIEMTKNIIREAKKLEYPDPLDSPDSFVQKLLQDINSAKRNSELNPDDIENIDGFESAVMDFLHTCSDPELGPEDLPGTSMIISVLNTQDRNNGISTFGATERESVKNTDFFNPGEIAESGLNASDIIDAGISLIPGGVS